MKQAEADIARLEDIELDRIYWVDHAMIIDQLESARKKYRSLKYEYTIQSSILILVAFTVIAVLVNYLFGGV